MSDDAPSVDELRALRVVDLKQKLSEIGLPQGGRKEDLVLRLSEHYARQQGQQEQVEAEADEEGSSGQESPHSEEELQAHQPVSEIEQSEFIAQETFHQQLQQELQVPADAPTYVYDQTHHHDVDETSLPEAETIQVAPEQEEEQHYAEESNSPEVMEVPQEVYRPEHDEPEEVMEVEQHQQAAGSSDDAVQETDVQPVQPPVVKRISLLNVPFAQPPALVAAKQAAARHDPTHEDLDGPPTPAGPPSKAAQGPVPLMSLALKPPSTTGGSDEHRRDSGRVAEPYLPKALEDALAFKNERTKQVGVNRTEVTVEAAKPAPPPKNFSLVDEDDDDDDEDLPETSRKDNKNKRQKKKKQKKKRNRPEEWARQAAEAERRRQESELKENDPKIEVEYIQEKLNLDPSDPMYRQFAKIFETFRIMEDEEAKEAGKTIKREDEKISSYPVTDGFSGEELTKVPKELELDDMEDKKDEDEDQPKLSKRKLKKLSRLSVAELKQLVPRPDVVEMHDVTAKDPGLLVHLKAYRNTVPVPRHWCFKRKYLQGKRGIEKPPFDLPDFIKKTGIMEMRAALQEKEEAKNLKSKMREKVRPKLGKIDIDYQKLHDAFFKWQTKPRMTAHGDLYYEGKEFEIRLKEKKPGDISDDLRTALGMPVGPNAHKVPPPWLIAMQRYGPPPSYPNLKIPGLNAAIPDGCSFGYHAGGWGKPPVDETGKPLYGDVFGTSDPSHIQTLPPEEIDQSLWGELESESEEEESEEEEDDEEGDEGENATGLQTPIVDAGLATPSGMSSVGGISGLGLETPELIELRKRKIEADMEGGETPSLYTILPERHNDRIGASMMGSSHTYEVPPLPPLPPLPGGRGPSRPPLPPTGDMGGGVELALNPEEVDLMDTDAMTAKAEAALRESQANLAKEDLSDMVAEHAAKQSTKRKRQAGGKDDKFNKKYKEFKF